MLLFHFFNKKKYILYQTDYLFILYVFLSLILYLFNSPFLSIDKIFYYFQIIIIQVVIYLSIREFNFSNKKNLSIFKILFWIITFSLIYQLQDSFFIYFDESKGMSTYQGLSRSLVLISIILIYSTKNRTQLIYFLFSAFILFLLGSRSEFALFIIASFMVNILNKKRIYLKIFSISLSVLLLFLLFNPEVANDLNNTSRIFSLLNPQLVYASEGRGILTYNAINTINENIFFGDIKNVKL